MSERNIEAIYPLSPMQEGMLFHAIYASQSATYFYQMRFTIHGGLNSAAFQQAWQRVMDRHPALRTCFVWERRDKPLQIVRQQVRLPLEQYDWRGLSATEQQERLEAYLLTDRGRGFKLSEAPLMRLALIQMAENTHEFIWSYQSLLLDGWSLPLILKEFLSFYEAFRYGEDIYLEPSRPYRDYITWLQQQDLSEAEMFWRRTLKGFTAPTPLGVGRTSGPLLSQEEDSDQQQVQLSSQTTQALQSLAREQHLTLNTLVQGAWALLLSRYSGEKDVVFGATTSGRPATLLGVESMVGVFINTLPVRVQVSPEDFLLPWLKHLQAQQVELLQYEYSPLVEVQGWSEVPRGLPLFESILVFENYPQDDVPFLQEIGRSLKMSNFRSFERTNYPLTVVALPGRQLLLRIYYHCSRFDAAAITRMLGHLRTVLESMVANLQCRLSDLPLLTDTEQHQLLVEWNNTKAEYPQNQCIHTLFEAQAERTPDAVAVVWEDKPLTYRELNTRANQLARYLRAMGIGPEALVAVCIDRSLEMAVGLLGILKAGGAYVPLDPACPKERLAFMLEDAQAHVLLTLQQLVEKLPEHEAEVVCLDSDWEIIAQESEENLVSGTTPENLVYVIYTSGSTGKPKGVAIQHAGLVNLVTWHQRVYGVTAVDRATLLAAPAFDASVWELWPYLTAGASLYIPDEETLALPSRLLAWLAAKAITICFLPTPLAEAVLQEQWPTGLALRVLLTGGDKLHHRPREALPFCLANNYGPTEDTVVTTWTPVVSGTEDCDPPPIGRPIANTQVYVLDRDLRPVPVGISGELYICGDGLARGYLNRPELTAEKFIPHPFSDSPGARLYRTGDLVRYLADGNIEFLGRSDYQVKVRGFRIELGEVEATLVQHSAVAQAVVVAREDMLGKNRLVAYVVSDQGPPPSTSELRSFLREKLPDYMVPSAFVLLGSLPLTPNGKVDHQALPVPDGARPELEQGFIEPRTTVEKILADIWAQILRLDRVGVHDNFFELGGDSILSLQIVAKANRAGLRLTPKQLFQHQTIAELAAVANTAPTLQTEQDPVTGPLPLSPIQRWFFEQNFLDPHHWNMALLLEVRQALNPSLLERVVQRLLVHHDVLRLRFIRGDSGWQSVGAAPNEAVPFSWMDLSGLSEAEQKSAIETTATTLQASLNLSEGPIMRVVYFDLGPRRPARLLWIVHHLIVDSVSWRILLEDFRTALAQIGRGEEIQLPPKTTSFKYWTERLQEYVQSQVLQGELDYWLLLSDKRISPLPVDVPAGANTVASTRTESVQLSTEETKALLQEVPKAYNTQINDALLTALVLAFSQWTGEPELLLTLEGHGREDLFAEVDLSRTVGWFTTLFPVRLSLEGTAHPGAALKAIKEQLRRVPNRGIGYGLLRYLRGNPDIVKRLRGLPQPQVICNYLGQFDQVFAESSGLRLAEEGSGPPCSLHGRRSHLLEINGCVVGKRLQVEWTYSSNLHRRTTVTGLAQRFIEALRLLIVHCQSPEAGGSTPSDFPLAGLDEQEFGKLSLLIEKADQGDNEEC